MKRFCMILFCTWLLSGCGVNREVLDDIYLMTLIGYDIDESEDEIEATIVVPTFQPEGVIKNEYITAKGSFGKDLEKKFMLETPKPIKVGKLEVAIHGESVARKGSIEGSDVALRDPSISSNLRLAVYDGNVKELILEKQNVQNQDLGIYISKIIEQNIKTETIPKTNIHLFFRTYYADGIDPFLPLLTFQNGKIKMKGLALFKGDQYVDEIGEDVVYRFTLLHGNVEDGQLIINLKDFDAGISLAHISSERKIKITGGMDDPKIDVEVKFKGIINEYYGNVTGIENKIKKIETSINKQVAKEFETMIESFQEQNIDPIGFGKKAKAHYRDWDNKKWKEIYPDLDINVTLKTDILQSGVIR